MALELRPVRSQDAAAIASIYGPIVVETPISFEESPPSVEQIAERIAKATTTHPWVVAECDGRFAGWAYASRWRERAAYRWSSEVSAYVAPEFHRRGVGRKLYERLFATLRRLNYRSLYAGITLPNAASVRLHESVGFVPVGVFHRAGFKFGQWHDVGWFECALSVAVPECDPVVWDGAL